MQPCKLAMTAAQNAQDAGVSISILPFIQAILAAFFPMFAPLLAACFPSPAPPTPATYREFITRRYNARKDRYAKGILNRAIQGIHEQTAKQGSEAVAAMNHADAETLAISTLDAVRLGNDEDIQEALSATATE